ncbi:hypothetical protein KM891_18275, partial [Bacillus pumilus]
CLSPTDYCYYPYYTKKLVDFVYKLSHDQIVVMAFYDSEDVILLTSSYLKAEGTVTNVEGRVTLKEATYQFVF